MNRYLIIALWFALMGASLAEEQRPAWNDINVIRENVEAPRAHFVPARDTGDTFRKSLNGDWQFSYSPTPVGRSIDFYRPDFDVSEWGTIAVPSNWERQGYGYPIYVNVP